MPNYQPITTPAEIEHLIPDDRIAGINLREAVQGYLECAEWIGIDGDEETPDDWRDDWVGWSAEALTESADDIRDLLSQIAKAGPLDWPEGYRDDQFGHDFWLTRNGHGTGYWDRGELTARPNFPGAIQHARHGNAYLPTSDIAGVTESWGHWLTRLSEIHGETHAYLDGGEGFLA